MQTNSMCDELNESAMQIILHAGNCRDIVSEALTDAENNEDESKINEKLSRANEELLEAHKIQTAIIQKTIMDEDAKPTLLFAHAQDTLMTIQSEYNLAKHLVKLYLRQK